MAKLNS